MVTLGDVHNFGQQVHLAKDGRVFKPRSLVWEWLFLASESPMRALIDDASIRRGQASPFTAVPTLKFFLGDLDGPGAVEHLKAQDIGDVISDEEWSAIGRVVGLCAWFGIGDLHHENLILGRSAGGNLIFAPIDIESILDDFELLSQTLLLPAEGISAGVAGMDKLIASGRGKGVVSLCRGYLEAFDLLEDLKPEIERILLDLPRFTELPCRLIFRPTRDYMAVAKGHRQDLDILLCANERMQLDRGDIPFYFRKMGSAQILFYKEPGVATKAELRPEITSKVMSYITVPEAGKIRRRNLGLLRKTGVMQLARAFDPGVNATYEKDGRLEYSAESIQFTMGLFNIIVKRHKA